MTLHHTVCLLQSYNTFCMVYWSRFFSKKMRVSDSLRSQSQFSAYSAVRLPRFVTLHSQWRHRKVPHTDWSSRGDTTKRSNHPTFPNFQIFKFSNFQIQSSSFNPDNFERKIFNSLIRIFWNTKFFITSHQKNTKSEVIPVVTL